MVRKLVPETDFFLLSDSFHNCIPHFSSEIQTNYCNNNPLTLDGKQLNKIIKLYFFHTLKALWDGQGKIKMYYGMSRVKKQLSGKRSIENNIQQPVLKL